MHRKQFIHALWSRLATAALVLTLFIVLSVATRLLLWWYSYAQTDNRLVTVAAMLAVGLVYDTMAAVYFVAPLALYTLLVPQRLYAQRWHRRLVLLTLLGTINLLIFGAVAEYVFWGEFAKRFNFIAVDYLVYTHEVIYNIIESYPIPLIFTLIFIVSCALFCLLWQRCSWLHQPSPPSAGLRARLAAAALVLVLPLLAFNIFDGQPLTQVCANQYNNELAKNGIYALFSAFRHNSLDYNKFYCVRDLRGVLNNLRRLTGLNEQARKQVDNPGAEQYPNVMLIMVESLSAKYMGIFGNKLGLTPHLDRLARKSLFFDQMYATGTRTVRGMEAVVLSLPPTPGRSIVKRPDCHNMFSSGFIFRQRGYENKFIYAGYGYFDNMNDFFSHNGFSVVDRSDFSADEITFANVWGACDGDLFNKVLKEADSSWTAHKPFFHFVMTTSNHRPYTYPGGKIDIPSHSGRHGAVKYTDYAINHFIEQARHKPWFDNTIFVIVADHNGGSAGKTALPLWRYRIPLLIYAPALIKPQVIHKLSSQVDIMPTLFALLGWDYPSAFYGDNILATGFKPRAFISTYQKLGLVRDDKLVVLTPDKKAHEYAITAAKLTATSYQPMEPLNQDIFDAISYYQSASYFYRHHLNRWRESDGSSRLR